MKRSQHVIRANALGQMPSQFIFVDTEALIEQETPKLQKHTLRLGHAVHIHRRRDRKGNIALKRTGFDFETVTDFWKFAESKAKKKKKLYLYAHNWNYDAGLLAMATVPMNRGWKCERYINERPPVMITLKHKNHGKIEVLDTLNYFTGSLEFLGQATGVKKGSVPFSWFFRTDLDLREQEAMFAYCRQDVEVIADLMMTYIQFLVDNELGNYQKTLASQAFSAFRHRFMHHQIFIHDRQRVCDLERDAYHGGRIECLFVGKTTEHLTKCDVNSLYPSVMAAEQYPARLLMDGEATTREEVGIWLDQGKAVIAEVALNTAKPAYAVVEERLTFKTGRITTSLCTPELRYALEEGHIEHVGRYAVYETSPIFADYVDHFYKLRQRYKDEGNDSYQLMTKLMMNALYGKFGQRGEVWEDTGEESDREGTIKYIQAGENDPVIKERVRMGKVQRLQQLETETRDSFPAIAAHVSAYARMLLWRAIETAGVEHVYYMDTDSLVVDDIGLEHMREGGILHDTRLGAFKIEGDTRRSWFRNVKDYQFGNERHIKGVSAKSVSVAPFVYRQAHFYSWDMLHSRGYDGVIYVEERTKTLAQVYKKGNVLPGGEVAPFVGGTA